MIAQDLNDWWEDGPYQKSPWRKVKSTVISESRVATIIEQTSWQSFLSEKSGPWWLIDCWNIICFGGLNAWNLSRDDARSMKPRWDGLCCWAEISVEPITWAVLPLSFFNCWGPESSSVGLLASICLWPISVKSPNSTNASVNFVMTRGVSPRMGNDLHRIWHLKIWLFPLIPRQKWSKLFDLMDSQREHIFCHSHGICHGSLISNEHTKDTWKF